MSCTGRVFDTHTYRGNFIVSFFADDRNALCVAIDTERLLITSVESNEVEHNNYAALFGDKNVMEKYGTGQTKPKEEIQKRIDDVWVRRWKAGDPYSGLSVSKSDNDDFLGHIILGHGDRAGESELAYLFHQSAWGKGYGTEAVTAVVRGYAPATVQQGYTLNGEPLRTIVATARVDNPASCRILEKVGMHTICAKERYGALRYHYSVDLDEF
jgi:ribosomal-protein-alanine N-acetyltransferase